jgi:hypothetical protein
MLLRNAESSHYNFNKCEHWRQENSLELWAWTISINTPELHKAKWNTWNFQDLLSSITQNHRSAIGCDPLIYSMFQRSKQQSRGYIKIFQVEPKSSVKSSPDALCFGFQRDALHPRPSRVFSPQSAQSQGQMNPNSQLLCLYKCSIATFLLIPTTQHIIYLSIKSVSQPFTRRIIKPTVFIEQSYLLFHR